MFCRLRWLRLAIMTCVLACCGHKCVQAHDQNEQRGEAEVRARSDGFHAAFNAHSVERVLSFCDSPGFLFDFDGEVMDLKTCKERLPLLFEDQPRMKFRAGLTKIAIKDDTGTVDIAGGFTSGNEGAGKAQKSRVLEIWRRSDGRWILVKLKVALS